MNHGLAAINGKSRQMSSGKLPAERKKVTYRHKFPFNSWARFQYDSTPTVFSGEM